MTTALPARRAPPRLDPHLAKAASLPPKRRKNAPALVAVLKTASSHLSVVKVPIVQVSQRHRCLQISSSLRLSIRHQRRILGSERKRTILKYSVGHGRKSRHSFPIPYLPSRLWVSPNRLGREDPVEVMLQSMPLLRLIPIDSAGSVKTSQGLLLNVLLMSD